MSSNHTTSLLDAAKTGNLAELKRILDGKLIANINECKGDNGENALMFAARENHLNVVKYLVEETPINLNDVNKDGSDVLSYAVWKGHVAVVKYLLANPALDVNHKSKSGTPPIIIAGREGRVNVLKEMVECQLVNVHAKTNDGSNALMVACRDNKLDALKYLVENSSINVNEKDNSNLNALIYACWKGHAAVVKYLLESTTIDVHVKSTSNKTVLDYICTETAAVKTAENIAAITDLLNKKLAATEEKPTHATFKTLAEAAQKEMFFAAVAAGNLSDLRKIVNTDVIADLNKYHDKDGDNALIYAAWKGHMPVVEYLLHTAKMNINERCGRKRTALMIAARDNHFEVVKYFHTIKDIEINAINEDGDNALSYATWKNRTAIVEYLIKYTDINLNHKSNGGTPPIFHAIREGHLPVVRCFHQCNRADMNITDNDDSNGLIYAAWKGRQNIVEYMVDTVKMDINYKNKVGNNVFLIAAREGHLDLLKYLHSKTRVNIHERNKEEQTALILASRENRLEVVKYLVDHLDINAIDKDGMNSLIYACWKGHTQIVEFLLTKTSINVKIVTKVGNTVMDFICTSDKADKNNVAPITALIEEAKRKAAADAAALAASNFTSNNRTFYEAVKTGDLDHIKKHLSTKNISDVAGYVDEVHNTWTALHWAANKNQVKVVEYLLQNTNFKDPTNVNKQTKEGFSALVCAASWGFLEVVRILGAVQGINVHLKDVANERNALHWAAAECYPEMVEYLLTNTAIDPNAKEKNGKDATELTNASTKGTAAKREQIIAALNAAKEKTAGDNKTYYDAVKSGDLDYIKQYIAAKNITDVAAYADEKFKTWTALHWASNKNQIRVIEYLLQNTNFREASNLNKQTKEGYSALVCAASWGHLEIVRLLNSMPGINVYLKDVSNERNALHWAAVEAKPDVVEYLLAHTVIDPALKDKSGKDAAELASSSTKGTATGRERIVHAVNAAKDKVVAFVSSNASYFAAVKSGDLEHMKQHLAAQNITDVAGYVDEKFTTWTALHWASNKNQFKVAEHLIKETNFQERANLNKQTKEGYSAFIIAASWGHLEMARLLNATGEIDYDLKSTNDGRNALQWAAVEAKAEMVEYILANTTIDPTLKDKSGKNATELATSSTKGTAADRQRIVTAINEANAKTVGDNASFYEAVKEGNLEHMTKHLAAKNITDVAGYVDEMYNTWTALHWAANKNQVKVVEYLLQNTNFKEPANVNKQTKEGFSPLTVAASWGHLEIVRLLISVPRVNVNLTDVANQRNAMHKAAFEAQADTVEYLLANTTIDPALKDKTGKDAADLAASTSKGTAAARQRIVDAVNAAKNKNSPTTTTAAKTTTAAVSQPPQQQQQEAKKDLDKEREAIVLEKFGIDVATFVAFLKFRDNELLISIEQAIEEDDLDAAEEFENQRDTLIKGLASEANLSATICNDKATLQSKYNVPANLLAKISSNSNVAEQRQSVLDSITTYQQSFDNGDCEVKVRIQRKKKVKQFIEQHLPVMSTSSKTNTMDSLSSSLSMSDINVNMRGLSVGTNSVTLVYPHAVVTQAIGDGKQSSGTCVVVDGLYYLNARSDAIQVKIKMRTMDKYQQLVDEHEKIQSINARYDDVAVKSYGVLSGGRRELISKVLNMEGREDSDDLSDYAGVVMEKGLITLAEYFDRSKHSSMLSFNSRADIAHRIAVLVSSMHERKLVHLDLKPQNIVRFMKNDHGDVIWKLIDFDNGTFTTDCIPYDITPHYTSYEQARLVLNSDPEETSSISNLRASPAMDICSMGWIYWQLFTEDFSSYWEYKGIASQRNAVLQSLGRLTTADIQRDIDGAFSHNQSVARLLKELLKVETSRFSAAKILNEFSVVRGGQSTVNAATIHQGMKNIDSNLSAIKEDIKDGFEEMRQGFANLKVTLQESLQEMHQSLLTSQAANFQSSEELLNIILQSTQSTQDQLKNPLPIGQIESILQSFASSMERQITSAASSAASISSAAAGGLVSAAPTIVLSNESNAATQKMLQQMQASMDLLAKEMREKNNNNTSSVASKEDMSMLMSKIQELSTVVHDVKKDIQELKQAMSQQGEAVNKVLAAVPKLQEAVDANKKLMLNLSAEQTKHLTQIETDAAKINDAMKLMRAMPNAEMLIAPLQARLDEQNELMKTLLENAHDIPSLIIVLPKEKKKIIHRVNFTADYYTLHFMCEHSRRLAPCGKDGKGYEFKQTKAWFLKVAPILQISLVVLKIALSAGGIPLPIGGLMDALSTSSSLQLIEGTLSDLGVSAGALQSMQDKVKEKFNSNDATNVPMDVNVQELMDQSLDTSCRREAHESIKDFFANTLKENIATSSGLKKVVYRGEVAWIMKDDDVERSFKKSVDMKKDSMK